MFRVRFPLLSPRFSVRVAVGAGVTGSSTVICAVLFLLSLAVSFVLSTVTLICFKEAD